MAKYNFFTGKPAKKVIYRGYKYLGKGKLGKLNHEVIDSKKIYYLTDYFSDFIRISPKTADKSKFKLTSEADFEYKGDWRHEDNYVNKQKPKEEIVFRAKIKRDENSFMYTVEVKLGKRDCLLFPKNLGDSNIIKDLQLKNGDKLIIKIAKEHR